MIKVSLVRWAALVALVGATACQTAGTTATPLASEPEATPLREMPEVTASAMPEVEVDVSLDSVYFDYDRWLLREDARRTLKENARKIESSPGAERLVIEGHCDERGSEEYNLALGDRRAATVAQYLKDLGVPETRIQTVSFGESRPAAMGHDEASWRLNRRSEIRFESRTALR